MPIISQFYGIIIKIPQKQHKLVVAWMEIHKDELIALWNISQNDG